MPASLKDVAPTNPIGPVSLPTGCSLLSLTTRADQHQTAPAADRLPCGGTAFSLSHVAHRHSAHWLHARHDKTQCRPYVGAPPSKSWVVWPIVFSILPIDSVSLPVVFSNLPIDSVSLPVVFSTLPIDSVSLPIARRPWRLTTSAGWTWTPPSSSC